MSPYFFSMRSLGSAALNCCMVACGAADVYFEYGIHCWDIAAAELIVREAGGVTMYPTGEKHFPLTQFTLVYFPFYVLCLFFSPPPPPPLFISGDPLNVMKRGILAASTSDLASQLVPLIQYVSYPSDC